MFSDEDQPEPVISTSESSNSGCGLGIIVPLSLLAAVAAVMAFGGGGGSTPAPSPSPAPAPSPSPSPSPSPTSSPVATCPDFTTDQGTITDGNGATLQNCLIDGTYTDSITLTKIENLIYSLGNVEIGNDAGTTGSPETPVAFTVEAGVRVFGTDSNSLLLVRRGHQIFINGTRDDPVIFTSRENIEGTTASSSIGTWGGIMVLGQAPIADCNTGSPSNPGGTRTDCENASGSFPTAVYGGDQPNDNSGSIRFLQIRYAGNGGAGDALALSGVGSATVVEFIQTQASAGDGIELNGGRVDLKTVSLNEARDDSLDTGSGYQGDLQFLIVTQRFTGELATARGFDGDDSGNEDALPRPRSRVSNFSIIGQPKTGSGMYLTGGGDYAFFNGIVADFGDCLDIDQDETVRAANAALDDDGPPRFESTLLDCANPFRDDGNVSTATIEAIFNSGSNNFTTLPFSIDQLTDGFTQSSVPAFDVMALSSFFETANYIGAIRNSADTRFQGWTCGLYDSDPECFATPPAN